MIVNINHTTKGRLRFENVGKFETTNNSFLIHQPDKSRGKIRLSREKVAGFSIRDMNKYD